MAPPSNFSPITVYTVTASPGSQSVTTDGQTTVATVTGGSGTVDTLHFPRVAARFVRVAITSASGSTLPELDELTVG